MTKLLKKAEKAKQEGITRLRKSKEFEGNEKLRELKIAELEKKINTPKADLS